MMKKLLALALVVFGLAACQTEPQFDVQMGGEQEVMLTVSLPEATRASSAQGFDLSTLSTTNSGYTLRYILEVYRFEVGENDSITVLTDHCQHFVKAADATSMVFPVRLAPGYNYRIVAWADIVLDNGEMKDRCYNALNGLAHISIVENMWKPMDESRDAFTGVKDITNFSSSSDLDMTLTRPFAKLRVVATDIEDIRAVSLEPTKATVGYYDSMPRSYDAINGIAAGQDRKTHEFSYPTTPAYEDTTGEYTLFADYIFVPADGTAQFSLDVYADDAKQMLIKNNAFNTEIFVERNKLTTIKGDVLTVGGNIEVTINGAFGGENEYIVRDTPANNEIWYTNGSTTQATTPYKTDVFGGANIVSNTYNAEKECWVIKFDGDVTEIGKWTFQGSTITSIYVPKGVTKIGQWAFYDCYRLISATIPDSVTEIADSAFSECDRLEKFNGKIASKDGRCLILNGEIRAFAPYGLTEYTIPDGVTMIGRAIFSGCSNLTSVTVPDSLTKIGSWVFSECDNLVKFNGKFASKDGRCLIINNVLYGFARYGISEYEIPDGVTKIGTTVFEGCDNLKSVTIPDSVTEIESEAFHGCNSLTSINIPDGVIKIGQWAFYDCSSLTSITIPNGVTKIEDNVFCRCINLASVTIPDSVKEIGIMAFYNCDGLTSVTIPYSVTKMGGNTFEHCSNLTSVYCKATTPPTGLWNFDSNASDRKIYVPAESLEKYKNSWYWSEYADDIVGYDFDNGVVVE